MSASDTAWAEHTDAYQIGRAARDAEVADLADRADRYRTALQRFANAHLLSAEDELDLDAVVEEAGKALGERAVNACPVRGVACADHGFVHGEEAEELRAGIERLASEHRGGAGKRVTALCDDLLDLLDEVDARDSLAFREGKVGGAP
jgi:hypothetical protein